MPVAAFKVAALGTADNAKAVAEVLADYPDVPVVFDPVSAPGGADADAELIAAMRELLLPQTTVLTVNLAQARRLIAIATDDDAAEEFDAARCARSLLEWGAENVLITQADATSTHVINRLFADDGAVQNESLDHADANFRGAGDTLSAGIAALLAQGLAVGDAVREANDYLDQALAGGYRVGMGAAIPDRLFWASVDGADDADAQDAEPDGTEDGERQ
jgi:hydroxymethylpyrimidine/phosphomethylpyrimidine kinase